MPERQHVDDRQPIGRKQLEIGHVAKLAPRQSLIFCNPLLITQRPFQSRDIILDDLVAHMRETDIAFGRPEKAHLPIDHGRHRSPEIEIIAEVRVAMTQDRINVGRLICDEPIPERSQRFEIGLAVGIFERIPIPIYLALDRTRTRRALFQPFEPERPPVQRMHARERFEIAQLHLAPRCRLSVGDDARSHPGHRRARPLDHSHHIARATEKVAVRIEPDLWRNRHIGGFKRALQVELRGDVIGVEQAARRHETQDETRRARLAVFGPACLEQKSSVRTTRSCADFAHVGDSDVRDSRLRADKLHEPVAPLIGSGFGEPRTTLMLDDSCANLIDIEFRHDSPVSVLPRGRLSTAGWRPSPRRDPRAIIRGARTIVPCFVTADDAPATRAKHHRAD
ncbi:hypothetical protein AN936_01965 [Sphingopyxis macrogoltabida]|uniref:Uncharacterized protein n=1 Tax=Sphingopyxis macrogoltabida TaxID=33050 RepID=A0A0N9URQ8_SPHMC|nr:hypothetical protein AN936_01965 [Sphingopyxis macrogoltabida]